MRNKLLHCALALLLALALCGCVVPEAFAYAEAPSDAIAIRITPPAPTSSESAVVEIAVTDYAGNGFQRVEVRNGEKQTWEDITDDMEPRDGTYYGTTELHENGPLSVRVLGNDGRAYEKSRDIDCFTGVRAAGSSTVPASASADPEAVPDTKRRTETALTPDGQGTMLDNVSGENGKEFFTIKTPSENVFYLIVDRERESENVYFLNTVTESDLMALAEKDGTSAGNTSAVPEPSAPVCTCAEKCVPGEIDTDCPVCLLNYKACEGVAREQHTTEEPVPQPAKSRSSLAVVLIAGLVSGIAGWYIKIYKPKKDLENAEDLDELAGGAEETINEDDMPPKPAPGHPEPQEPDYPEYDDYRERDDEPEEPEDYE